MIGKALSQSTNDKTFKENLKEISGARNIKLDMNKEQINIADKQFSFDQLGIKKDTMIQKLRENRAEKKPIRDHGYSMER